MFYFLLQYGNSALCIAFALFKYQNLMSFRCAFLKRVCDDLDLHESRSLWRRRGIQRSSQVRSRELPALPSNVHCGSKYQTSQVLWIGGKAKPKTMAKITAPTMASTPRPVLPQPAKVSIGITNPLLLHHVIPSIFGFFLRRVKKTACVPKAKRRQAELPADREKENRTSC